MKNIPLFALRAAAPGDDDFRFSVYASTRADELRAWGWSPEQRDAFLKLQFSAQERGYQSCFPDADRSLICLDQRAVGLVTVQRSATEIRLIDIALLPDARGRGLGGQVLRLLQDEAEISGRPLRLQVLKTNPARRWYIRLGFSRVTDHGLHEEMEWAPKT